MNTRTIIRAVHELASRGTPTTLANIARYLRAPELEVKSRLSELKRERIFDVRQRKGERVWLPWEDVN
jgi:hypothetical protein